MRRINSLPKVKFSRLERLYQTPKNDKASLSKVQALNSFFKLQLHNCVFPNFNLQIQSSKSNLRSSFANLFNFKFSKTCWKSPKLYKRILAHFEKNGFGALILSVFLFFVEKEVFCLLKWAKTNAFPNFNLHILSSKSHLRSSFANLFNFKFSKTCWQSPKLYKGILDPSYQTSKARIW